MTGLARDLECRYPSPRASRRCAARGMGTGWVVGLHCSFGHVSSVNEEGQVPDEPDHETVVRLYVEPVKLSPVRSDRGLLEPGSAPPFSSSAHWAAGRRGASATW